MSFSDIHRFSRRRLLAGGSTIVTVAGVRGLAMQRSQAEQSGTATVAGATPAATARASPEAAVAHTIAITSELTFDPPELQVRQGATVTWINDSPLPHTATGDPEQNPVAESNPEFVVLPAGAEPWGSPLLQAGDSYSHTFTVAGTYEYICIPHALAGMRGTIVVM